ncbi:MAG: PocR ligand-binding domain-containing protein [Clostridia bacterium]|nr:PocR ligand-binding domain-containing protein [Clostridia bacterium]
MIHKEEITQLLRALYEASGFRLSLHDATAAEIAAYPEGPSPFCLCVHERCGLLSRCLAGDGEALQRAKERGGIYIYRCHMGLFEAVSPIYQDNELLGFLMMGQVLEDLPRERERAAEGLCALGVAKEEATAATALLPACSRVTAEAFGKIMTACAGYIALSNLLRANGESPAEAARAYIENHFAEHLTIDVLCRRFHCCRATMTASYKKRYGETVTESLSRIRLEAARALLAGGTSVTEAAAACGFTDPSYFSKCFRRAYGYSPSKREG